MTKTKSNWPITILMAIVLCLIGVIAYILSDTFRPKEEVLTKPTINAEIKDITSLAIKNTQTSRVLVALTASGDEISLVDITNYSDDLYYDYDGEKIYLYLTQNNQNNLYYIDLTKGNNNYTLTNITNLKNPITGLSYSNNVVYYLYQNQIYGYDLTNHSKFLLDISNNNNVDTLSSFNNKLIYTRSNEIYIYDYHNIIFVDNGYIEHVVNNKIVYGQNNNSKAYLEYNLTNQNKVIISTDIPLLYNQIVPYNNGYIYINGSQIMMTKSDYTRHLYETDTLIKNITLPNNNELYINIDNNQTPIKLNMRNLKTSILSTDYTYTNQTFYK